MHLNKGTLVIILITFTPFVLKTFAQSKKDAKVNDIKQLQTLPANNTERYTQTTKIIWTEQVGS